MAPLPADSLDGIMLAEDRVGPGPPPEGLPQCQAFLRTYAATIRLTGTMPCDEMPEELRLRLTALARRTLAR